MNTNTLISPADNQQCLTNINIACFVLSYSNKAASSSWRRLPSISRTGGEDTSAHGRVFLNQCEKGFNPQSESGPQQPAGLDPQHRPWWSLALYKWLHAGTGTDQENLTLSLFWCDVLYSLYELIYYLCLLWMSLPPGLFLSFNEVSCWQWIKSIDDVGRTYYYQRDGTNSQWNLPEVSYKWVNDSDLQIIWWTRVCSSSIILSAKWCDENDLSSL